MGRGWLDDAAFTLGTELSLDKVLREGVRTTWPGAGWMVLRRPLRAREWLWRNVSDQHRWRTIPADWGLSGR